MADVVRAAELLGNSAALAFIACAVALPTGIVCGLLLSRRRIVGVPFSRYLLLLGLCIPLPVTALAWQVVLSAWLPPLNLEPGEVAWRPWSRGLLPAGIVHGFAAWPWVVGIVVVMLSRSDQSLEDQARIDGGERAVLRRVLVPQLRLAAAIAAAWVTVQCFTEIPIADVMMVRTFAEEIYTQLVGAGDSYSPALTAVGPASLLWAGVGFLLLLRVHRSWKPSEAGGETQVSRTEAAVCRVASAVVWTMLTLFVLVPIAALMGRAAGASTMTEPSAVRLAAEVGRVLQGEGLLLLRSLLETLTAAILLTGFAWVACWSAHRRRWAGYTLALFCLGLTTVPGPLVGLLLKEAILLAVGWEAALLHMLGMAPEFPPLRSWLYDQPSPLPMMFAVWLRYFPLAVLMFVPAFRAIPAGLWEAAAVDGLTLGGRWRRIVKPQTAGMVRWIVPACTVLMLGEVSAVKIVNPPFHQVYILRLFDMMHYGAETTVAVLALLQIVTAAVFCCVLQAGVTYPSWRGRRT